MTATTIGDRDLVEARQLAREFHRILPAASVLVEEEDLRPYECDGLTAYRQLPLLALLPETVEQVREIMRTCVRLGVPVVARGAGTGLSGGALPLTGGVLLSLARFNQIRPGAPHGCSPVSATSPSPRLPHRMAFTMRRTPPPRSHAALAATWRKTPADCTA